MDFSKAAEAIVTSTGAKVGPSAATAGVSAGMTAVVAVPLEAVFCGTEIHKLYKQKQYGIITD